METTDADIMNVTQQMNHAVETSDDNTIMDGRDQSITAEPLNEQSPEPVIEETPDPDNEGPLNDDEQPTVDHSEEPIFYTQVDDQGEQQSFQQSESPADVHPVIVDPEVSTSDVEMVDQIGQQTAEQSQTSVHGHPVVQGSEQPLFDTEMVDQSDHQTIENSEMPILDAEMVNGKISPHSRIPPSTDEMDNENEQETVLSSTEGSFPQVPEPSIGVEVDSTTVEPRETPQELGYRESSPSLFVTGRSPSVQPDAQTPAPAHPISASPPVIKGNSTFAKIRNLQQQIQQNKAAANKRIRSIPRQYQPGPGTLLDPIMMKRTNPLRPEKFTPEFTNEQSADADDIRAAVNYKRAEKHFEDLRRANKGSLTFKQDVEWMKIQSAEDARRRKRKRDETRAQAELFPEAMDSREPNGSDPEIESDPDAQANSCKRQRPEIPQKAPRQLTIQDAEMRSMMIALEANRDMPKRKKTGQADSDDVQEARDSAQKKGSKAKHSKISKPKPPGKKSAKGSRKSAKDKRDTQNAVRQVRSLFNNDVFEQQARQDAPDQPTFQSRNKQTALKELIASVPLGDNQTDEGIKDDAKNILQATKDFDGRGSVKSDGNGMWIVKGMKTSLKPYQLIGSAFMRRRENAMEEPRGGLVADQMGLGKTLMMLANIVNGRRPKGEKGPRTTLLVASPNLLTQWSKEIELHTDGTLNVMKYSYGNRLDSNNALDVLESHDIILTTYTEVMRSYPKNEPPITCQSAEDKATWWKEVYENRRGILHRVFFQRIVLDEAQAIKNHTTRTSIACRGLMAEHRWALSGTPILNALTELYPYFVFLNVPHTGSFKIFKNNYCDATDVENTERLLVRLSQFMLRRTHADQMFGAPILKLPKADQTTLWCSFNSVERNIYEIVHMRFAKKINEWVKSGELDKSYSNALVLLLRLRQLTSHVLMLQFVMRDLLEREDIELISEVVKEASSNNHNDSQTIIAIRKQLDVLAAEEKKKSEEKVRVTARNPTDDGNGSPKDDEAATHENQAEGEDEYAEFENGSHQRSDRVRAGRSFGRSYDFSPYLKSLTKGDSWKKAVERATCGSCGLRPEHPHKTTCQHLYCYACYEAMVIESAENGPDEPIICKKCGKPSGGAIPCDPDEEDSSAGPRTRSGMKRRQEKDRLRMDREDIQDDWLSLGAGGSVLPSAKTIAIKAQILNWINENPKVKIIVYTQFLPMIRILAKVCAEEGWPTEQYHGKLNYAARDKAVINFAEKPNIKVLLASLRCGGLGLNLTMASRVIVVDPWWNNASEQQAFCRVFRIGQKETTFMTRLCVKDTVDMRLIAMQKRKQEEIDSVMEDQGETVKKMKIKDLMRLFGNLDEDNEGRPFIVVDNPDPRGSFRTDKDDEGYAPDD